MPGGPGHEVCASREEGRSNPVPAEAEKVLSTSGRLRSCGARLDSSSSGGSCGELLRCVRMPLSPVCAPTCGGGASTVCTGARKISAAWPPVSSPSGGNNNAGFATRQVPLPPCVLTLFSKCCECALVALLSSEIHHHRVCVRVLRPLWCGVCVHSAKGNP